MTILRPALPVTQQFAIAVVSFPHALTAERIERSASAWGGIWKSWLTRLDDANLEHAIDDSWFFLPYIRRFLFPEFARHAQHSAETRLAAAKGFRGRGLPELFGEFKSNAVLRLTLADECLKPLREICISGAGAGDVKAPNCWLDWVDLVLFPGGVGSLLLRFSLIDPDPARRGGSHPSGRTTSDVADLLSLMKWIHPPRLRANVAEWRLTSAAGGGRTTTARELVDFLLQGLSTNPSAGLLPLQPDVLQWLDSLQTTRRVRFSENDIGETFVDRFTFYGFASLEQGVGERAVRQVSDSDEAAGFRSRFEQAMYELMTTRDSSNPTYALSKPGVEQLVGDSFHSLWRNWSVAFSDGNVAYLAIEDCALVRDALPATVESDYLYLFLLTQLQRTWVRNMLGELQRPGRLLRGDIRASRNAWERCIEFRSAFSFREVTSRPHGQLLHRRISATLGVADLLAELSAEIQLVQEHAETIDQHREANAERRTALLLGFIGFVGLPLSIISQLYGYDDLFSNRSWMGFAIVATVVSLSAGLAWILVTRVSIWLRSLRQAE